MARLVTSWVAGGDDSVVRVELNDPSVLRRAMWLAWMRLEDPFGWSVVKFPAISTCPLAGSWTTLTCALALGLKPGSIEPSELRRPT